MIPLNEQIMSKDLNLLCTHVKAMLAKETPEIIYKEVRELLVQPKGIKLMDEDNKLTI